MSGIKFINTQANTQYTNANTLKGWGLFLGRGTTDVNVINCSFIDFNHGVRIQGGSNFNIIQNCYFTGAATQVTNNGNKEQGTKAIGIMGSKGTKVINNIFNGKDVFDNSETIVKEGQTVQNEDYHKVYDALTAMKNVEKVTFSSKQEQYNKLTETMGSE